MNKDISKVQQMGEASSSESKQEMIHKTWNQILLKWLNKTVPPDKKMKTLNPRCLVEVVKKYKNDLCYNKDEKSLLRSGDIQPFLKYKYPLMKLKQLSKEADYPKKLYILTSLTLYHCCVNSQTGAVDEDLCKHMSEYEQEVIVKYCEKLHEMEITVNNVLRAVVEAFNSASKAPKPAKEEPSSPTSPQNVSLKSEVSHRTATPAPSSVKKAADSKNPSAFDKKSIVTVLPSAVVSTPFNYTDDSNEVISGVVSGNATDVTDAESVRDNRRKRDKMESVVVANLERNVSKERGKKKMVKESVDTTRSAESGGDHKDVARRSEDGSARSGAWSGEPGASAAPSEADRSEVWEPDAMETKESFYESARGWKICGIVVGVLIAVATVATASSTPFLIKYFKTAKPKTEVIENDTVEFAEFVPLLETHTWECRNKLCQRVYKASNRNSFESLNRCTLVCSTPHLWPTPIGLTSFSKTVVPISTNKLEYKFHRIPSEEVHQFLAEAFKLFLGDLTRVERLGKKNMAEGMEVKKISLQIEVESDADPRLRLNTDESYRLKIETVDDKVIMGVTSPSFCGVRHGLQTLGQLILLDGALGTLITLSHAVIRDAPTYKYRGLMVDTGRNYIPVADLMRTIDAMAMVKMNTFHWRITDAASFPLHLPKAPKLFEHGAYNRESIYTKDDVTTLVNRAGIRGVRVLLEVAMPAPVGRAWSWTEDVTCPSKSDNLTCASVCLRVRMTDRIFDVLQAIYEEILDMTRVDDVFHLSDGTFSLGNCYNLAGGRQGFLDKALNRLRKANKGFLPKLPIIWYSKHLHQDFEAKNWEQYGVQLGETPQGVSGKFLTRFKVIQSAQWDLSCEMKKQRCHRYRSWQEMYAWSSWKSQEVFTLEGGEAVLWTDLVNSGNLDSHVWPRAAAVGERLWSDVVANITPGGGVYVRLDTHRRRMLAQGVKVAPIWPVWCSMNPGPCLEKIR